MNSCVYVIVAPAVVHCFTGTDEELKKFVQMGLYIGITGWVCDDREGDATIRGSDGNLYTKGRVLLMDAKF